MSPESWFRGFFFIIEQWLHGQKYEDRQKSLLFIRIIFNQYVEIIKGTSYLIPNLQLSILELGNIREDGREASRVPTHQVLQHTRLNN